MSYTREHFQMIAEVLNEAQLAPIDEEDLDTEYGQGYEAGCNATLNQLRLAFARELAKTNSEFKRDRFLMASDTR